MNASTAGSGGRGRTSRTAGTNHPGGVAVNFYIKEKGDKDVVFLDSQKIVLFLKLQHVLTFLLWVLKN